MNRRDLLSLAASSGLGYVVLRFTPACSLQSDAQEDDPASARRKRAAGGDDDAELGANEPTEPGGTQPGSGPGAQSSSSSSSGSSSGDNTGNNNTGDDAGAARDSGSTPDAARGTVTLYDTNAQALYFDGTRGPFTGVVRVDYILANRAITVDFWHGHNGMQHRYTLLPEHFAALKRLERVTLETTEVDGHKHKLFVDPVDPTFRVPGATPVIVPV